MKKEQIIKEYNKMLKFPELSGDVPADRFNCYVCKECETITKTIDVDKGTTPFFHTCSNTECDGFATSTFYDDILPNENPIQEWFRPTLDETLQYFKEGNLGLVDHIINGGLDIRKIIE